MNYLSSNLGRIFVSPMMISNGEDDTVTPIVWRDYASNAGDPTRTNQFGVSFGGAPVTDQGSWQAATGELRSLPGTGDFFTWLFSQNSIDWVTFMEPVNSTSRVSYLGQVGNPEIYVRNMQNEGINIMALWDFRCRNLAYTTTDPSSPDYWAERWETYRLMYIGGRWLAKMGITSIELYNEPDKDTGCMTPEYWVDDARIRSQALYDSFADFNAAAGQNLTPQLVAPTLSVAWRDTYS